MFKPKWNIKFWRPDLVKYVWMNRDVHAEVYYGWRCVPNAMVASIIMGFNLGCITVYALSKFL